MDIVKIPVVFKSVKGRVETHEKYKVWEMSDPTAEEIVEDDLWYLNDELCEYDTIYWPKDLIGHYHTAEGQNTRVFHRNYDVSYIVPLAISGFQELID